MSLDKAITHGKEHRKPYRGCKAIAKSCQNHGGCEWCLNNRQYSTNKQLSKMEYSEKEWEGECNHAYE